MKLLNLTVRNSLALGIIIVLALAMLWLVNGQPSPPLAAQSGEATPTATTTPFPSATLTSPARPTPASSPTPETTALPSPIPSPTFGLLVATPLPNADVWPTSDATPITTDPYPIFDARILQGPTYTPTPIVTATPTPVPAVSLVSDEPLLSSDQLARMQVETLQTIRVEAWSADNTLILSVGYGSPTYWSLSRTANTIQPQPAYPSSSRVEAAAKEELRQFDDRVDYVEVSPDKQWASWGLGETLFVKRIGTADLPTNLLGKVEFDRFWGGRDHTAWTPQNRLAYVVENGQSYRFEIRISDPLSRQTTIIPLAHSAPSELAWSLDGQYLAFTMAKEPQSGINNLYVVKADGSGLTEVIKHGLVNGPILWSPTGQAIVYLYDKDRVPWLARITQ